MFHPLSIRLLSLAVLLLVGGCSSDRSANGNPPTGPREKVANVRAVSLEPKDLRETFTLPGSLEAWEDLTLAAELAGVVSWVGPEEGAGVKRGEPLLRIDPETQEANLARARAEFELQRKQLERIKSLRENGFASQQELDDIHRTFEVARADLQRFQLALDKSTLTSPVDGYLDRWLVDRGEYVAEGTPAALVVQVDRLKVMVEIPEKDVPYLHPGLDVEVLPAVIDNRSSEKLPGHIDHLAFKADPVTRTYRAKVVVDNRDGQLRPGMIVRVRFPRRDLRQVLAVPLYALVDREGSKVAFVVDDGLARQRTVTPEAVIGDRVVIAAGLEPGERLIVEGQHLVTDGVRVRESGD